MKPRRVMLMIEVETDLPLNNLRDCDFIDFRSVSMVNRRKAVCDVVQVQANVIRAKPKKKR